MLLVVLSDFGQATYPFPAQMISETAAFGRIKIHELRKLSYGNHSACIPYNWSLIMCDVSIGGMWNVNLNSISNSALYYEVFLNVIKSLSCYLMHRPLYYTTHCQPALTQRHIKMFRRIRYYIRTPIPRFTRWISTVLNQTL